MNTPPNHSHHTAGQSGNEPTSDPVLLDTLLRGQDPMTIEHLALRLGKPRRDAFNELQRLRDAGCMIDSHPQLGVTLRQSGLGVWADYLRWACNDSHDRSGRVIEVYRQTASTQDVLRRIVDAHGTAADAAVAIADQQTVGRGRLGRRWFATPGTAVTFSRVCMVKRDAISLDRLMLAVTVAVSRAIEAFLPSGAVQIRWPNDLLIDHHKVAGILIETSPLPAASDRITAIIGVGINTSLDPSEIPHDCAGPARPATNLQMHGCIADRLLIAAQSIRELDFALSNADVGPLLDAWRRRCPMLSQQVTLKTDGRTVSGQVVDLDPSDGLVVRTDSGTLVHLPAATTTTLA